MKLGRDSLELRHHSFGWALRNRICLACWTDRGGWMNLNALTVGLGGAVPTLEGASVAGFHSYYDCLRSW